MQEWARTLLGRGTWAIDGTRWAKLCCVSDSARMGGTGYRSAPREPNFIETQDCERSDTHTAKF